MDSEDQLFRSVTPPKGFPDGVFSPEIFFEFDMTDRTLEVTETSVSAVCAFADVEAAHQFGRLVAETTMAHRAARFGRALEPSETLTYAGFYKMSYSEVTRAVWKFHTVSAYLHPEPDLNQHFRLTIAWNCRLSTKNERKLERQVIKSEIARQLWGPVRPQLQAPADLELAALLPERPRPSAV